MKLSSLVLAAVAATGMAARTGDSAAEMRVENNVVHLKYQESGIKGTKALICWQADATAIYRLTTNGVVSYTKMPKHLRMTFTERVINGKVQGAQNFKVDIRPILPASTTTAELVQIYYAFPRLEDLTNKLAFSMAEVYSTNP